MAVEYNQHTWGYGEELTPDKLNNIEGGVKATAEAVNEVNNNLHVKTAELTNIGVKNLSSEIVKERNMVFVNIRFTDVCLAGTGISIGILPEGFRPQADTALIFIDNNEDLPCAGRIYPTGEIKLYPTKRNSQDSALWVASHAFYANS